MTDVFLTILNMSLTASYVILFIILVRLPLKKAPKVISYVLWSVAAFRLLCPFSFESILSLVPMNTSPIPQNIMYQQTPQINSGITAVDSYVNRSLPSPIAMASANPLQIYTQIGSYIWLLGIAAMLIYSVVSVLILKRSLKSARRTEGNIYEADNLKTPFVLGVFRPRIFIPAGLSEEEKTYIILHEQTHIHRLDHIIKPFAFLVLSIHWFNLLVWIAFVLMSTDMELSCDERVLKEMGGDIKKAYSASLLSLATEKRIINGSPLAFGEGNVRGRIKNVLNYKKPAFWVMTAAVIAVICVGIGLMANPKATAASENNDIKEIYQYRTQYVGDNSKVVNITDRLTIPKTLTRTQVQLYTDKAPYTIEVTYKTTPTVRESFSTTENQTVFDQSAVIMFALIGNADSVKFILNDGEQDLAIQRSRDWANEKMAKNVWDSSSTIEKFTALYDAISVNDAAINENDSSSNVLQTGYSEIKQELSLIPKEYSIQNAVDDGCFVELHGSIKSDRKIADQFLANTQSGKKASLKIVQYTTEGDLIITKVVYDGRVYYGAEDDSRDAFGGGYFEFEYPYLKIFQSSNGQYVYLVKDNSLTLDKIQKSYLSSKSIDSIDCRLLFVLPNVLDNKNKKESSKQDIWPADVSYSSELSPLINSTEISIQPSNTDISYCIVSANNGYLSSDTEDNRRSIKVSLNSAASVIYALSDGKSTANFDQDEITIDFYNDNLKKLYTCQIIVGKSDDDPNVYTLPAFPNWKSYIQE